MPQPRFELPRVDLRRLGQPLDHHAKEHAVGEGGEVWEGEVAEPSAVADSIQVQATF